MSRNEDQQALKRIMARLLGLAHLAERASMRSLPIRLLIVWLLRPAEAYARNLVMEAARDLGYQVHLPPSFVDNIAPTILGFHGSRSTDALRLAIAFQMLAAILGDLAELISRQRRIPCSNGLNRLLSDMKRRHLALKVRDSASASGTGVLMMSSPPICNARAPPSGAGLLFHPSRPSKERAIRTPALRPKNRSVASILPARASSFVSV